MHLFIQQVVFENLSYSSHYHRPWGSVMNINCHYRGHYILERRQNNIEHNTQVMMNCRVVMLGKEIGGSREQL